jgi:hypothetical protein
MVDADYTPNRCLLLYTPSVCAFKDRGQLFKGFYFRMVHGRVIHIPTWQRVDPGVACPALLLASPQDGVPKSATDPFAT